MKKKVLFLLYENETGHTLKVAENLISLYEPVFFSCDFLSNYVNVNPSEKLLKEFGLSKYKFYNIRNELKKISEINFSKNVNINFEFLKKFEKNHLNEKINQIILKDFSFNQVYNPRDYNYFPEEKKILFKTLEILIRKIEKLLKKNKFEFIYSGGKSNFVRNIILEYAKKKNLSFYGPSYRFGVTFLDNYSKKNLIKNLSYIKIGKNNNLLRSYIKKFNPYQKINVNNIYSFKTFLKHLISYLFKYFKYIDDWRNNYNLRINKKKKNYFFIKSVFFINYFLIRNTIRKIKLEILLKKKTKDLINNLPKKFIFYPLHFLPEGGIFDNKELFDEFFLVQQVSKKLPIDYKIIVKPHPEVFKKGSEINSCNYYNSFSKIPNVEIVSPSVNSLFLIKKSSGIISVSSSVALEAVFFKKNYLNFSENEFKYLKTFQKIDLDNLENQLNIKRNFSIDLKIINKLFDYGINVNIDDFIFKDVRSFEKNYYNNLIDKYLYYFKKNRLKRQN